MAQNESLFKVGDRVRFILPTHKNNPLGMEVEAVGRVVLIDHEGVWVSPDGWPEEMAILPDADKIWPISKRGRSRRKG